ncbi:FAD-binding oxidoreductase [Rhodospirillaceae bacterium SYSU D60014]|uniref:FAD-binding oxidoreductase n=1 Tax=Virgifigura deserti TaxID=2268457 RepID=UPI000E65F500
MTYRNAPGIGQPASDLLAAIKIAVGPQGWTDEPEVMAPHLTDQRGQFHGRAALLVRPDSTAAVAEVVRLCAEAGVPIVPQGGNTGLVGGATPSEGGEILLCLSRLNRIRAVDALNYTMTVEAGCILQQVQEAAAAAERLFPLSLGAEGSCQIGGNLSTNAGGIAVLRYGNARELVLGLEVVLPDGRVWDGLRALRKDNTGYDLKQLFIGAEGTLGIITAAVLKLFPKPYERITAFAALDDLPSALELLTRCRAASGDAVTSFELIPRIGIDMALQHVAGTVDPLARPAPHYLLIELTATKPDSGLRAVLEQMLATALEDGLLLDATLAESGEQARRLWHLREAIVEAQKLAGGGIKHDVSVPVSRIPEFVDRAGRAVERALPGIRPVAFGHLGDGNIHFNLCQPTGMDREIFFARRPDLTRIVHDIAAGLDGSISAEHGLGQLKRDEIARYKSPVELDLMRRIKKALDPQDILNPGKLLPRD